MQITKDLNEKYRAEKDESDELHAKFTEIVKYEMPRSSKEKIEANVFKKLYQYRHNAVEPVDPELTLKPNMEKTIMKTAEKKYYHNGKWEVNRFDIKQRECWSCCMNKEFESQGC
mmetsp:Transcript_30122/g.22386  ORF Transcript_30122/g.22386 Transcript_30122/m.22386 type:complete len:115 (+) Transcript_30122:512-856(+)